MADAIAYDESGVHGFATPAPPFRLVSLAADDGGASQNNRHFDGLALRLLQDKLVLETSRR